MRSGKRSFGPTSMWATATIEVPNMDKKNEPRDPSLALCQICDNADMLIPARDMDGHIRQFRTCLREVEGRCNDFIPGNIRRH